MNNWQQAEEEGRAKGWLLSFEQVNQGELIGEGSFGKTYMGMLGGQQVAVKSVEVRQETESVTFLRELGALVRARHPNIMAFKGAVLQHPEDCWLVVEYLPGGTLRDWLYGSYSRPAPTRHMKDKLIMALGVAQGMAALHALDPPIMHRDLKPSNVMLDVNSVPKVADFGLARENLVSVNSSLTAETGTYVYMSPEMVRGASYGIETDVYSFGIMLAELVRQKEPFADYHLTPVQVATGVANSNLRPHVTGFFHRTPTEVVHLMTSCWDANPTSRPSFEAIVQTLQSLVSKS